ncbi:MAG: hypothetical protein AAFP84_05435 [Actinomycetota bacterium]
MELVQVARLAAFNVLRLTSGFALVAILPLLVRELEAVEYNTWTILTQVPSYVALLGAGISVGVIQMVSARRGGDERSIAAVVAVASGFALRLAAVGLVAVALAAAAVPVVFSDLPDHLVTPMRLGVVGLGVGACATLLSVPVVAYSNGIGDNAAATMWSVAARVGGAVAVLLALGGGVAWMAAALGAALVIGAGGQLAWFRRTAVGRVRAVRDPELGRTLLSYGGTWAIWSVVSLVANGLDVAIVGALDFERVGAYGAAVALVMVVSGLHTAVMNAFLPATVAGEETAVSAPMLDAATRVAGVLTFAVVGATAAFGADALAVAFGSDLAADAWPILVLLVAARSVANLIWPYVVGAVAAGEHTQIRVTPVIEGVVNLSISLALVLVIGAPGAAIGTLIGSTLAVVLHLRVNVPRTPTVPFVPSRWWRIGVLLPASTAVPLLLATPILHVTDATSIRIVASVVAVVLTGVVAAQVLRPIRSDSGLVAERPHPGDRRVEP